MKGGLQLRIDRDPDFFEILRRSGNYITFVFEEKCKIIGSWSAVSHPVYIDGLIIMLHYSRDLKLDPEYQGSIVIFRMSKSVTNFQTGRDTDIRFAITLSYCQFFYCFP